MNSTSVEASTSYPSNQNSIETRPWGTFEILKEEAHYKTKKITIFAGQRISYQSHAKRAEHWIITKGQAEITLNDLVYTLTAGEHIFIPMGAKHRAANPTSESLEFIEVQTGFSFEEEDIVRYSDEYGRA